VLLIPCPHCGPRDESEFRYRGDASAVRPAADAGAEAFMAYVYERTNPAGWHVEWWLHAGGCRQMLKLLRHTGTHEIGGVARPDEPLALPEQPA
jgi:sarcosine oxidase subunit delta